MSELAYTPEESEDIFTTLKKAPDKGASLEELAKRYSKTPKSVKLHLRMKHPKYYNDWFGASAKADAKRLKVNELVDRLLEITNYDPKKRDWIKNTMGNSSFPQPFAEELYKQLVDKKLDAYIEELDWLFLNRVSRGSLIALTIAATFLSIFTLSTFIAVFIGGAVLTNDFPLPGGGTMSGVLFGKAMSVILIGITLSTLLVVYRMYQIRQNSLKQKELTKNKFNDFLNTLPDYLIDEINQTRLERDKTTHFPQ